jgi:hypothetical protein
MKMTVLYLKGCGHVMAALTRAALSEDDAPAAKADEASPEVTALVGDALPVRGFLNLPANSRNSTLFAIPASELKTLTLARNDDQLLSPRGYAIIDGKPVELSPATPAPTPTVDPVDATVVIVKLSADVTQNQDIMLHLVPVAGTTGEEDFFHSVFTAGGATKNEVRFRVGAPLQGEYDVLVLMADRRPAVRRLSVP